MIKVMAARDDAEFEQYFQRMIDMCEEAGFTADVIDKLEKNLQDNFPDVWDAYMNAKPVRR